ncbi:hypothetical protein ACNKHV_25160 [Shigella flexneri]
MSREDQFQRQRFHCSLMVSPLGSGWFSSLSQGAGDYFRVAGSFAFRRNAVVLLGGVGQVQD